MHTQAFSSVKFPTMGMTYRDSLSRDFRDVSVPRAEESDEKLVLEWLRVRMRP